MSKKTCFFVTPIGAENSAERKTSDKVLKNLLLPTLEKEFNVVRVDQLNLPDNINQTILEYLDNADLVIIDMTNHNPNVFYEFGYRHATGKPLIPIIMKNSSEIPFDVISLRTIFYSFDVEDINNAILRLKETIDAFDFKPLTSESVQHTNQDNQLLLLKISDKLEEVLDAINSRNDSETDKVAGLVAKYAQPQKSVEAVAVEQMISGIFQNPDLLQQAISGEQNAQPNL